MAIDPNDPIARIAAGQLGPAAQPAQAAQPAPPPPPPAPVEAPPTMEETAQTDAAPKTEADASNQEPYSFIEVDYKGQKRNFTPNQITGTLERYTALNDKHAGMKPMLDVVDNMVKTTGQPQEKVMSDMLSLMKAGLSKNTQMGGDGQPSQRPAESTPASQNNDSAPDPFANWESENDVALPPGYREQAQQMAQMQQGMAQMQGMMKQVLQSAQGTTQAAVDKEAAAGQIQNQAMQERTKMNLDQAAEKYGLTEEDAPRFQTFLAERGFMLQEMNDKELTERMVGDYVAAKNGPELARLQEINERRQAFQGTMAPTPAAGAGPAPSGQDDMLNRMTDKAFSKQAGMA